MDAKGGLSPTEQGPDTPRGTSARLLTAPSLTGPQSKASSPHGQSRCGAWTRHRPPLHPPGRECPVGRAPGRPGCPTLPLTLQGWGWNLPSPSVGSPGREQTFCSEVRVRLTPSERGTHGRQDFPKPSLPHPLPRNHMHAPWVTPWHTRQSLVLPSEEGLVPVTGPRPQEHRRPPARPSWGHMCRSHAPPMGTQPDSLGPRPGGVSKAGGLLSCLQSTSCDRGPSQWVRAGSSLRERPPSAKV